MADRDRHQRHDRQPAREDPNHRAERALWRQPDGSGWAIGDNLVLDIAGGHAAGLRTIWLQPQRRSESWSFTGPAPDFTVNSVAEAVEALLQQQ
jgi:FMN phosphatase YigB (HAD superfamily)